SDLTAAADQGWTNASANDFTIAGNVAGAGAIAKHGDGRIVLTGNDGTFTGPLTVQAGALQIRGTNALGSTGAGTTVADGAALELHGGGNAVDYAAEPLTISGTGVSGGGALRFVQNNVDYKGAITLAADARIQAASNSPIVSGAIAIGGYTLAVGVPADATELRLGGALSGTRAGSGEYALVKDGASRLLLTGNSIGLIGDVHLQEGEIRLGNANALGSLGTLVFGNNTVMKSASVADYSISRPLRIEGNVSFGEAATRTGTLEFGGNVDLSGGTRTVAVSNPVTKWVEFVGNLSNGNLTKAGPGLLILGGETAAGVGLSVTAGTLQGTTDNLKGDIANAGKVVFWQTEDGTYSGNLTGTGSLEKNGAGTLTLSGSSTHSGITMVNEGTLYVPGSVANSAFVVGSGGQLMGEGTVGDLMINGTVEPGTAAADVGTLNAGGVYLAGGGVLRFDIANTAGSTPGTDWDLIDASGGVTVNATEGDPFRVEVVGDGTGFDPETFFSWKIVDSALPVTAYLARRFTVDHTGFTNENMQGGSFMVAIDGDGDLALQFQIPDIEVRGGLNDTLIPDGDATPDPLDGTDFGVQSVNATYLQTFQIANPGLAPVEVSPVAIESASGFFTVTSQPPSTIESLGAGYFTVAYSPTATGTNTARVYVTNSVTGGKGVYTFDLQAIATIGAPSNLNVNAYLHEMVKIDWVKSASPVLLLHRGGADLTGGPANGTEYSEGDACGGGVVLYKGSATNLDHQVAQNTTNYYAVYSVAGSGAATVYSAGVTTWEAYTPPFLPGLILEPFSRTNGYDLAGFSRGQGWSGGWTEEASSETVSSGAGSLVPAIAYPPVGGNHAQAAVGNGQLAALTRWFTTPTLNTNLYVSWVMNVQNPGSVPYAGLEFLGGQGDTTPLFRAGLTPGSANAGIQCLL
ncbi:MAG: choice-of-anchor D domain-containing protein, partial [Spartobacteria bacterium]|nr:choice-of-anchor D domain-containing protein [Spartobacteria bacterium]